MTDVFYDEVLFLVKLKHYLQPETAVFYIFTFWDTNLARIKCLNYQKFGDNIKQIPFKRFVLFLPNSYEICEPEAAY